MFAEKVRNIIAHELGVPTTKHSLEDALLLAKAADAKLRWRGWINLSSFFFLSPCLYFYLSSISPWEDELCEAL